LRHTRGPDATPALRAALSDSDGRVRSAAASGLGSLNAIEAMDDLYRALDHKVLEAAAAIGQICKGDSCDRFVARAGKLQLIVLTSGIDQLLFRSALDVPDDQKIKIIGDIRELGTQEVNRYLSDVLGRWPAAGSPKVKAALEQAVSATRNSPGDVKKDQGGAP
jgi:HEAT repeat protein